MGVVFRLVQPRLLQEISRGRPRRARAGEPEGFPGRRLVLFRRRLQISEPLRESAGPQAEHRGLPGGLYPGEEIGSVAQFAAIVSENL